MTQATTVYSTPVSKERYENDRSSCLKGGQLLLRQIVCFRLIRPATLARPGDPYAYEYHARIDRVKRHKERGHLVTATVVLSRGSIKVMRGTVGTDGSFITPVGPVGYFLPGQDPYQHELHELLAKRPARGV